MLFIKIKIFYCSIDFSLVQKILFVHEMLSEKAFFLILSMPAGQIYNIVGFNFVFVLSVCC